VREAGLDLGVADLRQRRAGRGPTGSAARLFSTSPPWALQVDGDPGVDRPAAVGVECEQVDQDRDLSRVQAWKPSDEPGLVDQAV